MNWLKLATGRLGPGAVSQEACTDGPEAQDLVLRFDEQGRVVFCSMPLLKLLSVDVMHSPGDLSCYLARPAPWLDGDPAQWPAQLPTLVFRDRHNGELHARGCMRCDANGWYMLLFDVSDLAVALERRESRAALLDQVLGQSARLRELSALQLEQATCDWLEGLVLRLHIPWLGLCLAEGQDVRLYQSMGTGNGGPVAHYDDRQLASLVRPLQWQRQGGQQVMIGDIGCWIVPYGSHGMVEAWLVCAEYDAARQAHQLSAGDWQQLLGWFVGPLLQQRYQQRQSNELARSAVLQRVLGSGWWEYDPAERSLLLSDALVQQLNLGRTSMAISREQWLALIDPVDREELLVRLTDAEKQRGTLNLSLRLGPAGAQRWYRLQAEFAGSGRHRRLIGYALEIDDIKRKEAEAATANARLSSLLDTAPAFIYVQLCDDGALQTSYCSDSLQAVLGWRLSDFEQEPLSAKVHPEDQARFFARTRQLLQEGVSHGRYRLRDSAGRYHWMLDEAKLLRDEKGLPLEVVGLLLDVTEVIEATEKVRESEERYRVLVEDSPALICRYRPDLSVSFVNQTMRKVLASFGEDAEDFNLSRYLSAEQQTMFCQRLRELTPEHPVSITEVRLELPGQQHAWLVWADRGLFDETGVLVEVQAVGRDNTEVHRTRQQLYQSAKMATLGEMSTGLAHEINQPLNVMRMAVANLLARRQRGTLDDDYLSEKLQRIESQVARAAKIVEHVRVFGRRSDVDGAAFEPHQAVEGALSLLTEGLEKRGVALVLDVPPMPSVVGHGDRLEQVLINLVLNAQYVLQKRQEADADFKPQIWLRAKVVAEHVCLEVEDNGGGIDPHVIDRLFEPFFTTKPVGEGTGLGLSVSYGIIKQMGGELRAENRSDGACFVIELPLGSTADSEPETSAD